MLRTTTTLRSQILTRRLSPNLIRRHATQPAPPTSRLTRLESRLPKFLVPWLRPITRAPISHVTAFLLLHELTAIVPVVGLVAFFHCSNWLPPYISEGKWVQEATEKAGKYLRRNGWLKQESKRDKWFGRGEGSVRLLVEIGTAWAITKALLPVRLVLSVWATPWFARWTVLPVMGWVGRLFGRGKGVQTVQAVKSGGAGTGAVAGGVLPKEGSVKVK
ncbi:uncharacterized protein LTR77_008006 [Saxophila tyrrhenica]|uniref:Uncharacterized protein n=1 Tax=Saxophila tyrrhenica TaxID=1690608 RepID=A0AAV9P4J1_9PEZI|nr:hypothetical protein LTR77_008006 [Saxophila tyrrhenica]